MKKTRIFYILSCILPAIIFFIWTLAAFNMMDGFLNFILMLVAGVVLIASANVMGIFAYRITGKIILPNILMLLSRYVAILVVYTPFEKCDSFGDVVLTILSSFTAHECIFFVISLSALSVASGIIAYLTTNTNIVCLSCQKKFHPQDAQPKKITIGEHKSIKVLICPHCEAPSEKRIANPLIVSAIISIIFVLLIEQSKLFMILFFALVIALLLWYAKLKNIERKENSK